MYIRYKAWARDGLDTHTRYVGLRQLVFEDACQGVLDVRNRAEIESLLRATSRDYEIAYERYGVQFDDQGNEVAPIPCEPPPMIFPDSQPREAPKATAQAKMSLGVTDTVKRRGRPKRR